MICKSCQEAGDTLQAARKMITPLWRLGRDVARLKHQECTDCDCQHKLNNPHHA